MPASIWPGIDVVFLKLDFPVISLSSELELFGKTSAKADGYLCVLCEFFFSQYFDRNEQNPAQLLSWAP